MAAPTKTDLQKLGYADLGIPFYQVGSKSGLNLDGFGYSYLGVPFWAVGDVAAVTGCDDLSLESMLGNRYHRSKRY